MQGFMGKMLPFERNIITVAGAVSCSLFKTSSYFVFISNSSVINYQANND